MDPGQPTWSCHTTTTASRCTPGADIEMADAVEEVVEFSGNSILRNARGFIEDFSIYIGFSGWSGWSGLAGDGWRTGTEWIQRDARILRPIGAIRLEWAERLVWMSGWPFREVYQSSTFAPYAGPWGWNRAFSPNAISIDRRTRTRAYPSTTTRPAETWGHIFRLYDQPLVSRLHPSLLCREVLYIRRRQELHHIPPREPIFQSGLAVLWERSRPPHTGRATLLVAEPPHQHADPANLLDFDCPRAQLPTHIHAPERRHSVRTLGHLVLARWSRVGLSTPHILDVVGGTMSDLRFLTNSVNRNTVGVYIPFSGPSGWSGQSGCSGTSGAVGTSGWSGWSGSQGFSGWSGKSGQSGYSGHSGWSHRTEPLVASHASLPSAALISSIVCPDWFSMIRSVAIDDRYGASGMLVLADSQFGTFCLCHYSAGSWQGLGMICGLHSAGPAFMTEGETLGVAAYTDKDWVRRVYIASMFDASDCMTSYGASLGSTPMSIRIGGVSPLGSYFWAYSPYSANSFTTGFPSGGIVTVWSVGP